MEVTVKEDNSEKALYNPYVAKIATEFWSKNSEFGNEYPLNEIEIPVFATSFFSNPQNYFETISGYLGIEYYNSSVYSYGSNSMKGLMNISEENRYFSICICNNIIQFFFEKRFVLNSVKFSNLLNDFLNNHSSKNLFLFNDILESVIKYISDETFLRTRGVFIENRILGAKFSASADPEEVGEILAQARVKSGLSKIAVAAAADMQEKSVRQLEKGEQNPTLKTLKRYAESVGYDLRIELIPKDKS